MVSVGAFACRSSRTRLGDGDGAQRGVPLPGLRSEQSPGYSVSQWKVAETTSSSEEVRRCEFYLSSSFSFEFWITRSFVYPVTLL